MVRFLLNPVIHHRLCKTRLIAFVVAVAPKADQVNHDVLAEFLAVLRRKTECSHHSFGVFGVHVDNRRSEGFRHARAVQRAPGAGRIGRVALNTNYFL